MANIGFLTLGRGRRQRPVEDRFTPVQVRVLVLAALIQFVNMTDGIMINPMGPFLAESLNISTAHVGYLSGSYVLASCVAGLVNSLFLDRFDRRNALGVASVGLALGTMLGGFAWDLPTLMLTRVVAGTFGGSCAALGLAIIADAIPPEKRGRALGASSASFAAASVLGIPIGFELAHWLGWRAPFLTVGGTGLVIASCVYMLLPPQRTHMVQSDQPAPGSGGQNALRGLLVILRRPEVRHALAASMVSVIAAGLIVPNLAAYFTHNLGYPESMLGFLWAIGGVFGMIAARFIGALADKTDPWRVLTGISVLTAIHWVTMFVFFRPGWPLTVMFCVFVGLSVGKMTVNSSLMTRVTNSAERGRFLSLLSVAQSAGNGTGSLLAATFLIAAPDGTLTNMWVIGSVAAVLTLAMPFQLRYVLKHQKGIH